MGCFGFLEPGFCFEEQFLKCLALRGVGRDFQRFAVVRYVESFDITLHKRPLLSRRPGSLEPNQCVIVRLLDQSPNGKGMEANHFGSGKRRIEAKYLR
jgi:hypothetical protein